MDQENNNIFLKNSDNKVYYDFVCLIYIISLFAIDFLGYFNSFEIINPQYLYLSFVNIIMGLYYYNNSHLISKDLILLFKKSNILKAYLLFLFFCGTSIFFAKNIPEGITNFVRLLIIFSVLINLIIVIYGRLYLIYSICIIVGVALFFQVFQQLYEFINAKTILDGLINLKGNTGNINIFSSSIATKMPFVLLAIAHFKNWKKWFFIATLLLGSLAVYLTGTRSSMLSLFLEILVFVLLYLKIYSLHINSFKTILYLVIPIIVSFFIANQIFKIGNIKDSRYISVTNRIGQINSTDESTNARFMFWNNTIKIIQNNPVNGVGLGNYKIRSIPFEKKYNNEDIISVHPHNDFLEIIAETGIINGIIYILIFILILFQNIKTFFFNHKKDKNLIPVLTLLLLLSYGIDSLLNFPLYRPTMQIGFCFLMVLTITGTAKNNSETSSYKSKENVAILLSIIALITLFLSIFSYKASKLENEIKLDIVKKKSLLSANYIASELPKYPNLGAVGDPFVEYLAIYLFKEGRYKEATKYLDLSQKLNPYLGRTSFYKCQIAEKTKEYDKAFYYSKKAFYTRPRNINYFLRALKLASFKKDTTEILKIHTLFNQYRKTPISWKFTTIALSIAKYDRIKLLGFLDNGIKQFPKDTSLVNRKNKIQNNSISFVYNDLDDAKKVTKTGLQQITNSKLTAENTTTTQNNYTKSYNYTLEAKKLGDASKFDLAINTYKKALEQNPTNFAILQDIGICYFKLNQYKQAIEYLSKTINLPIDNDGKSEYVIGACYLSLKDKENGCKYLILAKNKNYPNINKFITDYCK